MYRAYPRAIIPRPVRDFDEHAEIVGAAVAAAGVPDYTYLWWDMRLHPRLGTLEVRAMDAPGWAPCAAWPLWCTPWRCAPRTRTTACGRPARR